MDDGTLARLREEADAETTQSVEESTGPIPKSRKQRRGEEAIARKKARRLKLNQPKRKCFNNCELHVMIDGQRVQLPRLTKAQAEATLVAVSNLGQWLVEAYSIGEESQA